jgi:hypothetical protein
LFGNSTVAVDGPCESRRPFALYILSEFYPSCPNDVVVFTTHAVASVNWTVPEVRFPNGTSFGLVGSVEPGTMLSIGKTMVVYNPTNNVDGSQAAATLITCSFLVRFWVLMSLQSLDILDL